MSTWLVVWFVIGLVTTVALIAFFVALGRHAVVLGRSARQMQEAVGPVAEDISRLTASQRAKSEALRARAADIRGARTRLGDGGEERR